MDTHRYINIEWCELQAYIKWHRVDFTSNGTLYLDDTNEYILNWHYVDGEVVPLRMPEPKALRPKCKVLQLKQVEHKL